MRHITVLSLLGMLVSGCSSGPSRSRGSSDAEGGESPQDVFDKAKIAIRQKDWKKYFALGAPEDRDEVVMRLIVATAFLQIDPRDAEKWAAELAEIEKRYGLDAEGAKEEPFAVFEEERFRQYAHERMKAVRDKPSLTSEIMTLIERYDRKNSLTQTFSAFEKAGLRDVKIEGEKATGMVDWGNGKPVPHSFVQHVGRWYVSLVGIGAPVNWEFPEKSIEKELLEEKDKR